MSERRRLPFCPSPIDRDSWERKRWCAIQRKKEEERCAVTGTIEPGTTMTNSGQPIEKIGGRGTVRTSDPYDVNV